jgi:hypothetical protein
MNTTLFWLAQAGFLVLTLVYFSILLSVIFKGCNATSWDESRKRNFKRKWVGGLVLWALFVSVWSFSGIMSDFTKFPFNFLPVIAIPLIAIVAITFSSSMTEVLQRIPSEKIIRLQTFRFFVEILLWALFVGNHIPIQMTFEGWNFDILSGISSIGIAWLLTRGMIGKQGIVMWNVVCLLLLINIVTIAILSTPSPVRLFMNDPANVAVTIFPISFLPGFLVPLAYMLHFFSLRQYAARPSASVRQVA